MPGICGALWPTRFKAHKLEPCLVSVGHFSPPDLKHPNSNHAWYTPRTHKGNRNPPDIRHPGRIPQEHTKATGTPQISGTLAGYPENTQRHQGPPRAEPSRFRGALQKVSVLFKSLFKICYFFVPAGQGYTAEPSRAEASRAAEPSRAERLQPQRAVDRPFAT